MLNGGKILNVSKLLLDCAGTDIVQHQADKAADLDVFVCGTEKTLETVKLCAPTTRRS